MNVSIAAYAIRVTPHREEQSLVLSDINGTNLFDMFRDFIQAKTAPANSLEDKTLLRTRNFSAVDDVITGIVELGKYGYAAEGVNIDTENETYRRTANDAEMLPFAIHVYIPEGQQHGILLLQRFGTFGLFTSFSKQLKEYFSTRLPTHTLQLEPLISQSLIDRISTQSRTKKLKFRKYEIPADIASRYNNLVNSDNAYIEYSIVAKRGEVLLGVDRHNLISLPDFEHDEAYMEVSLNGKTRNFSVTSPDKIRAYYDVHSQLDIEDTGHPSESSIQIVMQELQEDLWVELHAI